MSEPLPACATIPETGRFLMLRPLELGQEKILEKPNARHEGRLALQRTYWLAAAESDFSRCSVMLRPSYGRGTGALYAMLFSRQQLTYLHFTTLVWGLHNHYM